MNNKLIITIKGELPDLNKYIKALNSHRYAGSTMKKNATEKVALESIKYRNHKVEPPYFIEFHWYSKDRKIDLDNRAFGKKFILDGLQVSKVIEQDSQKFVVGFADYFYIDKNNPRIEVVLLSRKTTELKEKK